MAVSTSLRLWPGVVLVVVQWLFWLVLPLVMPELSAIGLIGGILCGALVFAWWLLFSRAPWLERIAVLALMVIAVLGTRSFVDRSISNGLMGRMLYVFSIPALSLALVSALALTRHRSTGLRRAAVAFAVVIACAAFTLLRTGGISGDAKADLHWRWTPTPEQRLLAKEATAPPVPAAPAIEPDPKPSPVAGEPAAAPAKPAADPVKTRPAEWPGFRGPHRDAIVTGVRLDTDWAKSPPVQMWRRPIGPAWSSFAVQGDLFYTQEQRGEDELVSCYRVSTGEPVWRHRDPVRFYESNAGAGPRATPAVNGGRVYALGATGILNALDARTGAVLWSRNAANDTGAKLPGWGFAGSPLVLDDLVIVATSGRLAAFEAATGNVRWRAPVRAGGYSSPQLMTLDGVAQILLLNGDGVMSVSPVDGKMLWDHAWSGVPMLQPASTADGDVLITSGDMMGGMGTRRIALTHNAGTWGATERWSSRGLKPYFNDYVVHKGYAFGFDGNILASIDVADGTRKWKGGRYGNGQLLLLPEQDLLLVTSEEGELVLVKATPDQFTEVARFPAIEGKTWNHPVLIRDILLVRNGEEMAAFRLPLEQR